MKITKQNYERFLIDFMDGKLDPSMEASLFGFLDENPYIKAEFEDFEVINTAVDDITSFNAKADLKKPLISSTKNINVHNYEDFFIASTEGDLAPAQEIELGEFIALNPALTKTQELYNQSKAQADLSIQYQHKKALKKYPFYLQKPWIYAASAAASILLLWSFFIPTKSDETIKQTQSAQIEERMLVPEKMDCISEPLTIASHASITPNFKPIERPNFASLDRFSIPIEEIQKLQSNLNTKEQLAALQPKFRPTRFILNKDFNSQFTIDQTNYAQNIEPKKKAFGNIIKGLFGKNNSNKTENKNDADVKDPKKIGPLWLLANIGLERVNEVTGTNMRLNSKANREGRANIQEKSEIELSRSAN